jgi:GR25 family glycosyltransferase involved in LPS biosynthesis
MTNIKNYLSAVNIDAKESGLPLIDNIFVINLEKRPLKWQRMKSLCEALDLKINRFNAVNGWKLSRQAIHDLCQYDNGEDGYNFRSKHRDLSNGHVGSLLSHLSIVYDAYQKGLELIWIMEDDVEFFQDIKILPNFISQLTKRDPEWDIFYTDSDWAGTPPSKISIDILHSWLINIPPSRLRPGQLRKNISFYLERTPMEPFIKLNYRWGVHSYLVSRKGMKKIVDYFNQYRFYIPIDNDLHFIPDIRQYALSKDITGIAYSKISDTYTSPRLFDRFFKLLIRQIKRPLRPIYRRWIKPLVAVKQ